MSASAMLTIDASMKSRKATAVSRASVSLPRRVARKEGSTVVAVMPTTVGADSGRGRHLKVLVGWNLSRPTAARRCRRIDRQSAALADKAELPSAGHGLGSVVRAELVEDLAVRTRCTRRLRSAGSRSRARSRTSVAASLLAGRYRAGSQASVSDRRRRRRHLVLDPPRRRRCRNRSRSGTPRPGDLQHR